MEENIKILEEFIKKFYESFAPEIIIYNPEIKALENLIKEVKKIKIENIEYKIGQMPDTTEEYKNLKKELEKWKSGKM